MLKTEKIAASQIIVCSDKKLVFYDLNIEQISDLANFFARVLKPADSLFLIGEIGSGKTFFARKVIQRMMVNQNILLEEVPSPTFTIIQVYDMLSPAVWHLDLYRLSNFDEAIELGLEDIFENVISLIEWSEKLGPYAPNRNISITFGQGKRDFDTRTVFLEFNGPGWENTSESLIKNFLK
tara:strand:+ start:340 stop:882 length:543 start_codon:yes stop_codon:yes gene_type:complete